MSGRCIPWTREYRIALAITFFITSSLTAQQDKVPGEPVPAVEPAPRLGAAGRAGQNAFKMPRSQSVIQCFEILRQTLERKDYIAALPLIERVLSELDTFVPNENTNEVAAHEEGWRLLQSVPLELRQRFTESRQAKAKREWDQARSNGVSFVNEFLKQFSDTPSAVDAWWWIGCHEWDHGRANRAAAAFERAATHPEVSPRQRAMGLLAAREAMLQTNGLRHARRLKDELTSMDADLALEVRGKSLTLGQYLTEDPFAANLRETTRPPAASFPPIEDWRRLRPTLLPIWKQEFTTRFRANLEALELKQRDQGIRIVPIVRPLIVGQTTIIRTLEEIKAFELSTGKPLWSVPNVEFEQIGKRSLENSSFQMAATELAQRRTHADSIFGRMSSDGRQVFAIQEPDRSRELQIERGPVRQARRAGPRYNQLCSYSIDTGARLWEASAADGNGPLKDFVFLGCPLLLDDLLYVVAQRETELSLLSLDPETGVLHSSLALGSAPIPIELDLQRSRVACPIVWFDGLLLCSTSSGAVVAVDPILQTVKWGYRYLASNVSSDEFANGANGTEKVSVSDPWWDSWREPFASTAFPSDQKPLSSVAGTPPANAASSMFFVFASPESDELHAIRLPSGDPVWSVPRNGGLLVAGIVDDLVIVVEGFSVRAHDLDTGKQRWRTPVNEISAPAVLSGSVIVIPVYTGGTVLLDARNGEPLSSSSQTDSPMGVLSETENGWVALHRQSLQFLPRLEDVRRRVERELQNDPGDESLRVHAALLDLQAGEVESARKLLEGLTSSSARDLRTQALIAALGRSNSDNSKDLRTDLARELTELAENAEHKFAAAAAIGTSALAVNDLSATVDAALTGLSSGLDADLSLVKRSSVMVRKDRILLGLIEEAFRRARPDDLAGLDELFNIRIRQARKSRDRLAVQELADLWRGIEWGRRLMISDEERVFRKRSLTESELRLLDAAGALDSTVAVQALDRLAQRFDRLGMDRDARSVRDRIQRELPDARFPDGKTESERTNADPNLREARTAALKPIFPEVEPAVEQLKVRNFEVFCPYVPVEAEPGSLASRLDITIDRTGSEILFRGESFFQSGQDEEHERKLPLPKTMSPLRGLAGQMLRRAWGIGRIVVVQVGSELYAITPLDDQGNPNSRFLWSNPIDLQIPFGNFKIAPERPGIFDPYQSVVDDSDRPIAKVGPVRAGYLCYQSGNRLVAIETESGRELWRHHDCPSGVTVLGDDQRVYLWHNADVVEILSAVDGRRLDDGVGFASPDALLHHRGSLAWTISRKDQLMIQLHDFRTGKQIWSRQEPAKSLVAVLDQETLAIATPDGQCHLLQARTGKPICDPLPVATEGMTDIAAWQDEERWYIGLSRPVENLTTLKSNQLNGGYRFRFLNGPLYAVKREQPQIVWEREFKNEPLAQDQSRVAPVLVQLWRQTPRGNLNASQSMLRMIDKRTGRNLFANSGVDILPYFLLNSDPQLGILELKLTQETIRLNYDKSR